MPPVRGGGAAEDLDQLSLRWRSPLTVDHGQALGTSGSHPAALPLRSGFRLMPAKHPAVPGPSPYSARLLPPGLRSPALFAQQSTSPASCMMSPAVRLVTVQTGAGSRERRINGSGLRVIPFEFWFSVWQGVRHDRWLPSAKRSARLAIRREPELVLPSAAPASSTVPRAVWVLCAREGSAKWPPPGRQASDIRSPGRIRESPDAGKLSPELLRPLPKVRAVSAEPSVGTELVYLFAGRDGLICRCCS